MAGDFGLLPLARRRRVGVPEGVPRGSSSLGFAGGGRAALPFEIALANINLVALPPSPSSL